MSSTKCLFMHELLQTLAPAGRHNKLQTNISPNKFRTISFWVIFSRWNNMSIMLMSCCLAQVFCRKKFSFSQVDIEDPSYSMIFASLNTHRHIWNICINVTVDVRPSSHQTIGFYTLNPATCHHLHRFFILLVGLQLEKHTINQPKLPSQNMQTRLHHWNKNPNPKNTWKWINTNDVF